MNKEQLEKFINETLNAPYFSSLYDIDMWREDKEELIRDLEVLEKLEAKTHLLYKDRKAIAKEFDKWCEDNNAVNCSENMATWFLSFKLKEWLENEK